MKIAFMSGAYVNAGDFLIEQRGRCLLEKYIDGAHVHILKRNISYDDRLDDLHTYDLIVFGGGPGYQKNLYPRTVPFVSDLSRLKIPVAVMGWGWKGRDTSEKSIYGNRLSEPMMRFVRNAENHRGGVLGCRDWYTVRFLKNLGFGKCQMTGCPAWYDLDRVEGLHVDKNRIKMDDLCICISDAAFPHHKCWMRPLVVHMRRKYPRARICLVFHRGITEQDRIFTEPLFLEKYRLEYRDISGSAAGFSIYDTCDLHIGFRVHAHIYCLSRGKISVLINEDARGCGVNDALGLWNINLSSRGSLARRILPQERVYLFRKTVDDYLECLSDTDYMQYEHACSNIQYYHEKMQKFVQGLAML